MQIRAEVLSLKVSVLVVLATRHVVLATGSPEFTIFHSSQQMLMVLATGR